MRYIGPIYRPPSEADSLLIQATVGCPHNRCTFCMVYKKGPRYRVRAVNEIKEDLLAARDVYGQNIRTLFFPAGNTIAMKTEELCEICRFTGQVFPDLQRITVYGSSQYIHKKSPQGLKRLAEAGLSRIHVGLESGDDMILKQIKNEIRTALEMDEKTDFFLSLLGELAFLSDFEEEDLVSVFFAVLGLSFFSAFL